MHVQQNIKKFIQYIHKAHLLLWKPLCKSNTTNTNLTAASAFASYVHVCRMCTGQRKSKAQNFLILKAYCKHPKCKLHLRLALETCNIKSKVHTTNARMSGGVAPLVQIYASASLHPAKNLVTYLGKFIDINPRFSAMHVLFFSWHSRYLVGRVA